MKGWLALTGAQLVWGYLGILKLSGKMAIDTLDKASEWQSSQLSIKDRGRFSYEHVIPLVE